MAKPKFALPKYRKHQAVRTPDGTGRIESIDNTKAGFLYYVNKKLYLEDEIKSL